MTPVITEGYNISPCLITLFGMDCSTASKRTELRHCDMEEKSSVSNIDLQNSPLLADTNYGDESHELDFAEEKIAVSIGRIQKGNLLVQDQVDENQSVDSGSSLQSMKNVLLRKTFLFRMEFYKMIHFYLRNLVKHNQRISAVIKNFKV